MANLTEADAIDFGNGPIHVLGDPNSTPEADNIDTSSGNLDYSIQSFGGDDVIVTGDGDADLTNGHTVQGGDGNDTITGGAGNDNLRGGTFNSADADGDDTINGGGGDDNIVGGLGNDTLNGDAGTDGIDGEGGNDIINGGAGNDLIWGGAGNDTIDGGDDHDVVFIRNSINAIDSITYNAGTITIVGPEGTDTAVNVEQVSFTDNPVFFDAASLLTQSFGTAGDDTLTGDDENNYLIAGAGNDTISGGLGIDSIVAGKGNDTVDAGEGNDTILSGEGDNTIDGGAGDDLVGYNFSRNQIISIKRDAAGVITLQHSKGTDTLINVEAFDFFPSDSDGNRTSNNAENVGINDFATVFTGIDDETINGTAGTDVLDGGIGNDTINGLAGNDTITGGDGDDIIDGGDGIDTASFGFATTDVTTIQRDLNGVITLVSANGTDTLSNIEALQFSDQTLQVSDLVNTFPNIDGPKFTGIDSNGNPTTIAPTVYKGAVSFLEYQHLGANVGDVVTGSDFNDFINLLGGDDAANGGAGQDVLDGGTGSNFLTGGSGADTFFLDGRGGTTTWSTVTDFSGDNVNIWGWQDGVSKLIQSVNNEGADGFKGATFHYDLNNDGLIDTSITFSGLTTDQVPGSSAQEVAGNGYLLFA